VKYKCEAFQGADTKR